MIWVGGRVVPDDALSVSALDRTFEHGLGLFETFRTWGGRAPLMDRHLARMTRSAEELGLPTGPAGLPDADAVAALLEAQGVGGDVVLRVTRTGGTDGPSGAALWMRAAPLPPPTRPGGAVVASGLWEVTRGDPLARHKTLNYWGRRRAFEEARRLGYDETVSTTFEDHLWEGSRTNLFLVRGSTLSTPPLGGPIVPGVMRALVLELAPGAVQEVELTPRLVGQAGEVFLTNSVRGIMPVARLGANVFDAPGPWTRRLQRLANDALGPGGTTP